MLVVCNGNMALSLFATKYVYHLSLTAIDNRDKWQALDKV